MALGTAWYSTSTARSSRARLIKHDEKERPTRSRVSTQRHLVTSTDVHHLVVATSPAGMDTRRGPSNDWARPEGLSPRCRYGLRLAILAALKLALDAFAAFVFRACAVRARTSSVQPSGSCRAVSHGYVGFTLSLCIRCAGRHSWRGVCGAGAPRGELLAKVVY